MTLSERGINKGQNNTLLNLEGKFSSPKKKLKYQSRERRGGKLLSSQMIKLIFPK